MQQNLSWLPELIFFSDYQGNFSEYIEAVYQIFREDFIENKAYFEGQKIALVRHPLLQNKEAAFWHVTSEGKVEEERTPDFRRCERVAWIKAIIDNSESPAVKVWENRRSNKKRVCLWLEQQDFLVVLEPRSGYTLLRTAYPTTFEHTRKKLRKEFQRYVGQVPPS